MKIPIINIGKMFRAIIEPLMQDIADEYNSLDGYRAIIGHDHPKIPRSRAISSQRGQSKSRAILRAVSIKVYDENNIITVSVFYPQESQFVFVMKLGVLGAEQIKLAEITPQTLKQKIKLYLPQIT